MRPSFSGRRQAAWKAKSARRAVAFLPFLVVAVLGLTTVRRWWQAHRSLGTTDQQSHAMAAQDSTRIPAETPAEPEETFDSEGGDITSATGETNDSSPSAPRSEPTPQTRQLVARLTQAVLTGHWTPEAAAQWQEGLQQLIEQGGPAIAAIREFLELHQDGEFGPDSRLEYRSLRAAFFTTLQQMGGPEAQAVLLQTLQSTAVPAELAQLARYFEWQWPGQFRKEIVQAARTVLTQSKTGELPGWDIGPVFNVLQAYGDASVVTDLEASAAQWNYYSALALANLPTGAGLPSLIRLAQESAPNSSRSAAVEALAQVAVQSAVARAALKELLRASDLPERTWEAVARALAGEQHFIRDTGENGAALPLGAGLCDYHLEAGNQYYYSLPASGEMSGEQVQQRIAVLDQLLAANPTASAAQALASARSAVLAQVEPARVN